MTSASNLFELAQLAEASYAEFNLFANNDNGVVTALKAKGFSKTQADVKSMGSDSIDS